MHNQNRSVIESNDPSHYKLITIGVVVGLIGVFLRFVADSQVIDIISNILFVIGSYICLKAVLNILK